MTNEFKTLSWDEPRPETGQTGPRIAQAHVRDEFTGVIAGTATTVVPGSGTGDLAGLRGDGGFVSSHGDAGTAYTFDFRFES